MAEVRDAVGLRMSAAPCTVKLDVFEGPLDLLLHLIKKNEVQITDIPIATITDQYLALLEELPELNLDGAGEYLVMAATLTYIKSRMLLPADPDDEGEAEDDPRAELVQQLLEYQRYREAAADLGERRVLDRDVFAAPGRARADRRPGRPECPRVRDASLADLLDALRDVLSRLTPAGRPTRIVPPGLSVAECVERILARFALGTRVEFAEVFSPEAGRGEVIVTFLALLELIRLKVIRAVQHDRFGPIQLELARRRPGGGQGAGAGDGARSARGGAWRCRMGADLAIELEEHVNGNGRRGALVDATLSARRAATSARRRCRGGRRGRLGGRDREHAARVRGAGPARPAGGGARRTRPARGGRGAARARRVVRARGARAPARLRRRRLPAALRSGARALGAAAPRRAAAAALAADARDARDRRLPPALHAARDRGDPRRRCRRRARDACSSAA